MFCNNLQELIPKNNLCPNRNQPMVHGSGREPWTCLVKVVFTQFIVNIQHTCLYFFSDKGNHNHNLWCTLNINSAHVILVCL